MNVQNFKTPKYFNARRLSDEMTDKEWQEFFSYMKSTIKPIGKKYMDVPKIVPLKEGQEYHGEPEIWRYRQFINDILHNIRQENIDYCFFVFQIKDLLKHEPRLKAKWLPLSDCFCVEINE